MILFVNINVMKVKTIQLNNEDLQKAKMEAAVNEVFKLEGDRLFNFIRSKVPTQEDAEDIFQETFYQLTDAYHLAKDIRNGGAWVFRVARNKIIDFFRKHKTLRLDDMTYRGNDDGDNLSLTDIIPSSDKGPENEFLRNMVTEVIEDTLAGLPENQREVFEMHEFEGISFKEIEQMTGVPLNTLLSRKRYAILQLRSRLESLYEQFNTM